MSSRLSARSRLTLLYASLFTLGGAALVMITYLLVAHTLQSTAVTTIPRAGSNRSPGASRRYGRMVPPAP